MRFKNYLLIVMLFALGCVIIVACEQNSTKTSASTKTKEVLPEGSIDALPLTYKDPADNPTTAEKIELGRLLFYDPILSGNKDVACASCHHPEFGYAESLELPIGVNGSGLGEQRVFKKPNDIPFTKRNSQSILNTAFNGINEAGDYDPATAPMFWDLRAHSLEQQALKPIETLEEMRGHGFTDGDITAEVISRLKKIPQYKTLFTQVFGEADAISEINLGKALATFQRSLTASNSRFDQYMRGDKNAMGSRELDGMRLFLSAGCARCHSGPMFSDFKPHVLGVADHEMLPMIDSGMNGTFAFRTPTLRNLRRTRPYMHNGKIQTLERVLTFYEDLQGKELPNKNLTRNHLDSLAKQIKLDFKNINAIVDFLNTLNDDGYDKKIPDAVPSGLPVGGNIRK